MNINDSVKSGVHSRSGFDLSFDGVISQSWGDIVPIVCKEMVPGDSFTCDASAFVRLAPLATPTYGRIHGYINYFFVPNRILLTDRLWENFIRGGATGKIDYSLPYFGSVSFGQWANNTSATPEQIRSFRKIVTYFGLPDPKNFYSTGSPSSGFRISALPFAAYNRIFGDYFYPWGIDENGDASAENLYFAKMTGNAQDVSFDKIRVHKACFKKDYMTTAQISPQRGLQSYAGGTSTTAISNAGGIIASTDNIPTASVSVGISALGMKWANALQNFLERNNVAGARYFEQILSRFGIKIEAERLQRSEYLGGSDFWINVSDVTATSKTYDSALDDTYGQLGEMAGKGVGLGKGGVSYSAKDYGFFIATLHLMPESGVVQGLNRMWTRSSRFDYFTPEFEETGMQPIYNCELWAELFTNVGTSGKTPVDSGVYGYIPRYAEYKYSTPLLGGDFRMRVDGDQQFASFSDMDSMHLYRIFTSADGNIPVLSPEFVQCTNETAFNRIFQDTNDDFDHFWTNIQVSLGATRPMLGYVEASTAFNNDDHSGRVNIPLFGVRL